jgi:hypothetical protein
VSRQAGTVARVPPLARAVAAVAAAVTFAAACGDDEPFGRAATEAMVLETCAPSGEPLEVEICRCAFNAVADTYDAEELERLDRRLRDEPDQVPVEVQEAILDCTFDVLEPPAQPTTSTTAPEQDE